mmetsp:Transcript_376/g.472  ORF Transcript_376/g.472 Transcript_376/m.472 type:complete len:114 (+) Transcript_376:13-354(+)
MSKKVIESAAQEDCVSTPLYNIVISHLCAHHQFKEAYEWFYTAFMDDEKKTNLSPDIASFSPLIECAIDADNHQLAHQLFLVMRDHFEIKPSKKVYKAMAKVWDSIEFEKNKI